MTIPVEARGLTVTYPGTAVALASLNVRVEPGRCLGVIGESGSGKSTFARSLLGLIDGGEVTGHAFIGTRQVVGLSSSEWRELRWRQVAMTFQATGALNPSMTIGDQVAEPIREHLGLSSRDAAAASVRLLERVGLGEWAMERLPSQLSGGQRRLCLVAIALACDPAVLVLDEPTSGLDAFARRNLIELLISLRHERKMTQVLLSHDIELVRSIADDAIVLYRGWAAEQGVADGVLDAPGHPYSWALLNAVPTMTTLKELRGIRGRQPSTNTAEPGCRFASRCTQAIDVCHVSQPSDVTMTSGGIERLVSCHRGGRVELLKVTGLHKRYEVGSFADRRFVHAVAGVDLALGEGEVLGILGGNGAGKSTMSMMIAGLMDPESGNISFEGKDLKTMSREERRAFRQRVQLVQQDPFEALSPRMTVRDALSEPLQLLTDVSGADREIAIVRALEAVRLPTDEAFLRRYPHELSGGQLQRINIARAIVIRPKVLILDEPVAMLDPSEQAEVLHLLKDAQVQNGMAMVLVSHDLPVLFRVADRIAVMNAGRVEETGNSDRLLRDPQSEFMKSLLAAIGAAPGAAQHVAHPPISRVLAGATVKGTIT